MGARATVEAVQTRHSQRMQGAPLRRLCLLGHDPATVRALGRLLGKTFYLIVREAPDDCLSALRSEPSIDGLVLDVPTADSSCAELIRTLRAEFPGLQIFLFTSPDVSLLSRELSCLDSDRLFRKPRDIWRLAERLYRELAPTQGGAPARALSVKGKTIAEAIDYIEDNLSSIKESADVSDHLNVSREHLSRQFTKYAGHTLWDFINMCRVDKAKQLLTQRDVVLKHIYPLAGFNCHSSFFRAFTKHTGLTPEGYRRALLEADELRNGRESGAPPLTSQRR